MLHNQLPTENFKSTRKTYTKKLIKTRTPKTGSQIINFGFRQAHSTVQKCHRVTDVINKAVKIQQYCTAVFSDISQAFDKLWQPELLLKIKRILTLKLFQDALNRT